MIPRSPRKGYADHLKAGMKPQNRHYWYNFGGYGRGCGLLVPPFWREGPSDPGGLYEREVQPINNHACNKLSITRNLAEAFKITFSL